MCTKYDRGHVYKIDNKIDNIFWNRNERKTAW